MTVQASEQLKSLTVSHEAIAGDPPPCITVHLPSGMAARAEVLADALSLGDALEAVHVERDSDGNGAAITSAVDALSMRGTKEFAGYEHGSTTSAIARLSYKFRKSCFPEMTTNL